MKIRSLPPTLRRLREFLANSNMTTQFVLSYLLLIILPVAAIILFSYQLSEQHI